VRCSLWWSTEGKETTAAVDALATAVEETWGSAEQRQLERDGASSGSYDIDSCGDGMAASDLAEAVQPTAASSAAPAAINSRTSSVPAWRQHKARAQTIQL